MLHIEVGLQYWPLPLLVLLFAGLIVALGKGADLLVDEAVRLSVRWKMPQILVAPPLSVWGPPFPRRLSLFWRPSTESQALHWAILWGR